MELSNLKEELSLKSSENDKLIGQGKSLRDDLHEAKLELAKLHLLDSLQQEVKRLKEQLEESLSHSETVNKDLKASQLKVLALEDDLHGAQQRCRKMGVELDAVEKERGLLEQQLADLKKDMASLKERYEQQVWSCLLNYTSQSEISSLKFRPFIIDQTVWKCIFKNIMCSIFIRTYEVLQIDFCNCSFSLTISGRLTCIFSLHSSLLTML